ncbi:MAG: hypothetical protein HKP34_06215 [Nitrosopumilus sp.]|nr:hypothetical protein [Nitrosopumilus sp.]NNL37880.1 hypothetical protein [Nitrosopumilus sp.]
MNNLIIIIIVGIIAAVVLAMGQSNYQEVSTIRDQRNLELSLNDCKRLYDPGLQLGDCYEKSINVFGTEEQKLQWQSGYFNP